ncbi:unnamed protein product, partial [marine sediment metagenome]
IIIYVIFRLLKKPHETVLTKLSNLLKISMAAEAEYIKFLRREH